MRRSRKFAKQAIGLGANSGPPGQHLPIRADTTSADDYILVDVEKGLKHAHGFQPGFFPNALLGRLEFACEEGIGVKKWGGLETSWRRWFLVLRL